MLFPEGGLGGETWQGGGHYYTLRNIFGSLDHK